MPDVIGIRFKACGKIYDFEINGIDVKKGDAVVVESELGLGIGNVVVERHSVSNGEKEFKKILRKVTEEDLRQKAENDSLEAQARSFCVEKITARGLPMKLVYTEVTLDKKRIIFYFTADGRIDFRELVKDLAAKFRTRIEMRQIGVRDEAKVVGGFGMCGRELCCKTFLTSFEPISIRMAKSQELVLNASKLSGICGRLMCCLSYEYCDKVDMKIQGRSDEAIQLDSDEKKFIEPPTALIYEVEAKIDYQQAEEQKTEERNLHVSLSDGERRETLQENKTDVITDKEAGTSNQTPGVNVMRTESADSSTKDSGDRPHRRRKRHRRRFHR